MTTLAPISAHEKRLPAPPTGVAVVGYGYWGRHYVRLFREMPDAEVLGVCDRRSEQLGPVQRQYPDLATTTNIDDVLDDPDVDAIVVATTASTHFEVTRRALEAGKHVLVEKPLTTDTPSSRKLVELARELGLVLMVGHTFIYNEAVRTLCRNVDPASVYYLYARRSALGPVRADVNAIWDLAPHDISIFNKVLGARPEWVSASGSRVLHTDHEDMAFITLGYPNGVLANLYVSWADPNKCREVVVVCRDRRIVFNDVDPLERVRIFEKGIMATDDAEPEATGFGEHMLTLRDGQIISPTIPASEPLKNQCGHFLHCIRRGELLITPGEDGLAIVAVMEAIDESMRHEGVRVPVEAL